MHRRRRPEFAHWFVLDHAGRRDGPHRLVIDRHARRAYAADAGEARRVVREQCPAEEPVRLSPEETEAATERLRQALASLPPRTAAEIVGVNAYVARPAR